MPRRADAEALIEGLRKPGVFGADVANVGLVETHISWVLLTGTYAYKIKKPIKLPFLDFTSLGSRRHYCQEELRLNQRLASELYLDVIPIGGTPASPKPGAAPAIEFAVKMREFPATARLDRRIADGAIGESEVLAFAELIGRFHTDLPPADEKSSFGKADAVLDMVSKNAAEAAAELPVALGPLDAVRSYLERSGQRLRNEIEERKRHGAVKEVHGDLHLENLVVWDGRIIAFDALEFDPSLRWLDVIDETAFVTMDLVAHGREDLAFELLNRYLEVTGDYEGLALLRFYMTHRALVRAKVSAIKATQRGEAGDSAIASYLSAARRLIEPGRPILVITHGLSGSGKTTWTDGLVAGLPALRLRSDLERKRLTGLGERGRSHSPIGGGIYTQDSTEATYARLARLAELGLAGGLNVIVDATFLKQNQRRRLADVAALTGAGFAILDCHAEESTLRRRIALRSARNTDASEATEDVLDFQLGEREKLTAAERKCTIGIDAEHRPTPQDTARLAQALAGRLRSAPS